MKNRLSQPLSILYICLVAALLASCTGVKKEISANFDPEACDTLRHAKGFKIEHSKEAIRLTVINPWKEGEVLARYYLIDRNNNKSTKPVYADGHTIEVPLQRTALTSCTQIGFLDRLRATRTIAGISYPERVFHAGLNDRIQKGEIVDLGDPFRLDIERLLACRPEVVFVSGYNQQGDYEKSIEQSGITVVYINEWMESTALARAEWIRFVGYLFQEKLSAEKHFEHIEQKYIALRDSVRNNPSQPRILSGEDFRGSWYMAKADNWMSRLYVDAGGNYPLAQEPGAGSQAFALEEVYKRFSASDKWMGVDAKSLDQLKEKDARYAKFKAFQQGEVYHFNKRTTPTGGNDFWEEGVVDPSGMLSDLINVFHGGTNELYYTGKLN